LPRKLRSAFPDFLKRRFEATKFLLAQFMEYPFHLRGVLSKDWNNEILVACGEGDDPKSLSSSVLSTRPSEAIWK